jgi:primary-amine oxidase
LTPGLGLIHYFSGDLITSKGDVKHMKNVICMHEQDEGIGWKRLWTNSFHAHR